MSDEGDQGGRAAVAVYGAAGAVGRQLIGEIADDGDFAAILAVDDGDEPPTGLPARATFRRLPTGGGFEDAFREAGVRLAVYLAPSPSGTSDRALGVDDTPVLRSFLEACEKCGVEGVVVASGANVYGARAENPSFFSEGAPIRCAGFPPGEVDLERERLCAQFASRRPAAAIAVCRLAHVIGPGTHGLMSRFFRGAKLTILAGFDPPIQFVHAEDVANVALRLLKGRRSGVYNVAADDYTTFLQLGRTFKKPLVRLSPFLARVRAWLGMLTGGLPLAYVPLLRYPLLLSNRKVKRDTGYQFRYGSEQALAHHARRGAPGEPQAV